MAAMSQRCARARRRVIWACAAAAAMLAGSPAPAAAVTADLYRVEIVQTNAQLSQRMTPLADAEFETVPRATASAGRVISVDASVRYQRLRGFGAAMTDTSAWLIETRTSAAARAALMGELFGAQGIRLNFLRVPMGASDFTHGGVPYTYDDLPPGRSDPRLRHFSVAHDEAYILPALRQARALDPDMLFLANPWSAPAWMKDNDSLNNVGGRGILRPGDFRSWAAYFVRFIRAYAAAGVPIGAVTVQNEPGNTTTYPGMSFPASSEAAWIVHDLRPALAAARMHPEIYAGDLGWAASSDPYVGNELLGPAAGAFSGVAWHCYFGAPGVMAAFHRADPRLDEIVDECSPGGISPTPMSEIAISSLRNWASSVALWNLALDPKGGPVQRPNHGCPGCEGLATIDEASKNVVLGRSYYQLGQASAFIDPGARRIASTNFVTYSFPRRGVNVASPGLDDVAFRNPDGSIVLVAYDNGTEARRFAIRWRGRQLAYTLPARATATFVWNRR